MTARKPPKAKAHRCPNPYAPCHHASHANFAKPKGKTIRAWAVVCAEGLSLHKTEAAAVKEVSFCDVPPGSHGPCGPHTVVELSGTFTAGRKG